MTPYFDRFDICEAYLVLEWDYNRNGWLRERPSNRTRWESTGTQLSRIGFKPRLSLGGYKSLTPNGKAIYRQLEARYGLKEGVKT
jgi:hypothetical protein